MSVAVWLDLVADDEIDIQPQNVNIYGLMIHEKDISGVISFSRKVEERRNRLTRKSYYSKPNKKRRTTPT
jgi:hypothetical protein